jgi:hypothetical protein
MTDDDPYIEPIRALDGEPGPVQVGAELRRHERRAWNRTLTVHILESSGTDVRERSITVNTIDLSCGGVSFNYRQFLFPGTIVRMRLDNLSSRPTVTGTVIDCRHVGGSNHRIGVRFDSHSARPPARRPRHDAPIEG